MPLKIKIDKDKPYTLIGPPDAPYLAAQSLLEAVNLALVLHRPLLLQGEPGSGKTMLAQAVAWELYGKDWPDHFFDWHIKSTTKAQEGRYTFDHIQRLRDAQLIHTDVLSAEEKAAAKDPMTYVHKGVLWHAFTSEKPAVLLIDEIDKADLDFPNDLLMEMDKQEFHVPEVQARNAQGNWEALRISAKGKANGVHNRPLILITSNREKELPDAFLRRCIYYFIEFPSDEQLTEIVLKHFAAEEISPKKEIIAGAVAVFSKLRGILANEQARGGAKNVSTSELLDWCKVLHEEHDAAAYGGDLKQIPFLSVLLKTFEDHQNLNYYRERLRATDKA